jgi:hypothetical protein
MQATIPDQGTGIHQVSPGTVEDAARNPAEELRAQLDEYDAWRSS